METTPLPQNTNPILPHLNVSREYQSPTISIESCNDTSPINIPRTVEVINPRFTRMTLDLFF